MTNRIDTAAERGRLVGNEAVLHRIPSYLDAIDAKDAEIDRLLDEIDRMRDILRTITSRAQSAKRDCESGAPINAYNLASGILGQIGADVAALSGEGE